MTATQSAPSGLHRLLSSALLHPSRFSSSRIGREGQDTSRVLLIGDRHSLVSKNDPEVRLAEHLADAVVSRTGRGLKLDTVWDLVPVLRAIGGATQSHNHWQYDAIVVLIHNSPTRLRSTGSATVHRLLMRVLAKLGPSTAVELVFLDHPSRNEAGRAARRFSQQVMTGLDDPHEQVQSITVPSGLADASGDAAAVADTLALRLVPHGTSTVGRQDPRSAVDPSGVQAMPGAGLQRVVTLAVRSFDVPFAAISLFDGPAVRTVASSALQGPPIDGLLHAFEQEGAQATLVPDTADDPLLRGARPDQDDPTIRFWAAYPIESVAGEVLGAVSVFDVVPHELFREDENMLRDLAQLAGAEIDAYRPDD